MTTIYEASRRFNRGDRYDGEYGIEIETEALDAYRPPAMKFWRNERDGSLRDFGVEYILKNPVTYVELDTALEEFQQKTEKIDFVKDSITTSVHVHINFMNHTFLELAKFLTCYTLVENILIRHSGPDRLSNLFCLPICDSERISRNIVSMIKEIEKSPAFHGFNLNQDVMKYGALNLSSLATRNSVEVRSFRGVVDTKDIYKWVSILNNLKTFALSLSEPGEIIDMWRDRGVDLLPDIFGDMFKEVDYEDNKALVLKNLWYAKYISGSVKDWKTFGVFEPRVLSKKEKNHHRDRKALEIYGQGYNNLRADLKRVVDEDLEIEGFVLDADAENNVNEEAPVPQPQVREGFRIEENQIALNRYQDIVNRAIDWGAIRNEPRVAGFVPEPMNNPDNEDDFDIGVDEEEDEEFI